MYSDFFVPERARPAKNATVISATPKNTSAQYARTRQKTKLITTYLLSYTALLSVHFLNA